MSERYVVITENSFSKPMSKEEAIKTVKSYSNRAVNAYIVSEEEAKRIKSPDNFNIPKWE